MTYRAHLAGFQVIEVPITFHERRAGQSKMNANIVTEALTGVWRMRFSRSGGNTFAKSHAS
jgi:dolichol-phosphate mannosyltransferase